MPVTPFHFGPGAAVKAAIPRHFSFTVFCFAQVVTDCETAYHMLRHEYPLHRWMHTYASRSQRGKKRQEILPLAVGLRKLEFVRLKRAPERWQSGRMRRFAKSV